jgi:hypothetical protein
MRISDRGFRIVQTRRQAQTQTPQRGNHMPAQGNALGIHPKIEQSPVGAQANPS